MRPYTVTDATANPKKNSSALGPNQTALLEWVGALVGHNHSGMAIGFSECTSLENCSRMSIEKPKDSIPLLIKDFNM